MPRTSSMGFDSSEATSAIEAIRSSFKDLPFPSASALLARKGVGATAPKQILSFEHAPLLSKVATAATPTTAMSIAERVNFL